jgi:hypothetical protein
MQKWIIGLIAATTVALTGCGSTCDSFADSGDSLIEKVKPCLDSDDDPPAAFNVNQCERAFENCTDSEKEALDEYLDCLDKLEACTPGTKDGFRNALEACNDYMDSKVGETCQEIFE